MIKNLVSAIFLFLFIHNQAQNQFQQHIGGNGNEYAFSAQSTSDGNLIFAGYGDSYSVGANDLYLVKTDTLGNVLWAKAYGGIKDDEGYSVIQAADGGYAVAGYTKSFGAGNYDALLIKLNANGDTVFSKAYGGARNDYANCIIQTADGGYMMAGYTVTFVAGTDSGNAYIIKTDASGNLQWSKSFGGTAQITDAYNIKQTQDKGYAVVGYTNAFGELNGDVFLTKMDSLGNIEFTTTYGGKGVDWAYAVIQNADGSYNITGTYSTDSTSTDMDVYMLKAAGNGDTLYTKTYGGTGYDFGQYMKNTSDGGFVLTGYTNSYGAGSYDVLLIKTNNNGDTSYIKAIGDVGDDEGNAIVQLPDNNFCIAASGYNSNDDYDFYLINYNPSAPQTCHTMPAPLSVSNGKGNVQSVTATSYTHTTSVTDAHPVISNGNMLSEYCGANGIEKLAGDLYFLSLFPNPGNGIFSVQWNGLSNANATITDMLGNKIYDTQLAPGTQKINLSNLVTGTYLIQVSDGTRVYRSKILINK